MVLMVYFNVFFRAVHLIFQSFMSILHSKSTPRISYSGTKALFLNNFTFLHIFLYLQKRIITLSCNSSHIISWFLILVIWSQKYLPRSFQSNQCLHRDIMQSICLVSYHILYDYLDISSLHRLCQFHAHIPIMHAFSLIFFQWCFKLFFHLLNA